MQLTSKALPSTRGGSFASFEAYPGRDFPSRSFVARRSHLLLFALSALGYMVLVPAGLASLSQGYAFAMVWPASALAGALIYLTDGSRRLAVVAGVIVASMATKMLSGPVDPGALVAFSLMGPVGPWLFAALLGWVVPKEEYAVRPEAPFVLLLACIGSTLVSGLLGAGTLHFFYGTGFVDRWFRWTLGEAVGMIALAPLILQMDAIGTERLGLRRIIEGNIYLAALISFALLTLSYAMLDQIFAFSTVTWLCLPLLLLANARGSRLHGAAGMFFFSLIGVSFIVSRSGIFAEEGIGLAGEVILFQVFVLSAALCMAIVGIYEKDREKAEVFKREQAVLESVTDFVAVVDPRLGTIEFANNRTKALMADDVFRDFMGDPVGGKPRIMRGPILEAVRKTASAGETRREVVFSESVERWFELDLYISPQGVTIYGRDITDEYHARETIDLLAREMNHRIQNFFAVSAAIVSASAKGASTPQEVVSKARERFNSLSRAYAISKGQSDAVHAGVTRVAEAILEPYREEGSADRISIVGEDSPMTTQMMTPFSLILHELATNSVKYGALGRPGAAVVVSFEHLRTGKGPRLNVVWDEKGVEGASPPTRTGFGTRMIDMAAVQLGGTIAQSWKSDGIRVALDMPLPPQD
jgi:two-component sensor histidine kinase/integral membrane sensor domain MASE1